MARFIPFVAKRLAFPLARAHSALSLKVQVVLIALCLMALITVMSVMSGFQASFIKSIYEVSSYHLTSSLNPATLTPLNSDLKNSIQCVTPFADCTALLSSDFSTSAAILRFVEKDSALRDKSFMTTLNIISGTFCSKGSVAVGSALAYSLGVNVGSTICASVLNEKLDAELLSERVFTVSAIFETGYYPINESYVYAILDESVDAPLSYGVKLKSPTLAPAVKRLILSTFQKSFAPSKRSATSPKSEGENLQPPTFAPPNAPTVLTATEQNTSFFGALKTEKLVLTFVMTLILLVTSLNIYNNTRRVVFIKQSDIATLESFGACAACIQAIFVLRSFIAAAIGVAFGVALGVVVSANMTKVFYALSTLQTSFSDMFYVYSTINTKTSALDVLFFSAFCLFASVLAAFFASSAVTSKSIKEVLHSD